MVGKKKQKNPEGEMPFLDHLEELRWRILWSVLAVAICSVAGFYVVRHFDIVELLKGPIEPHLTDGRLVFTRPTDAFLITLKLSVLIGVLVSAPFIMGQVWRFLAPALHVHERRRIVPATLAGVGLFAAGAWMAFRWILPAVLRIMLSPTFVGEGLEPLITAGEYFGLATQIILAFGLVFELPLVMVMLAAIGLVSPHFFARHRPYAFLVGAIVAAFLTPPDIFSMMMMMAPIILLYEVGIGLGKVIWKRRERQSIGAET
jgi:sec-independent protein translocase protein TatC